MQVTDLRLTRRANLRTLLGGSAAATALTLAPHLVRTAGAAHTPFHGIPISGTIAGVSSFVGTLDVTGFVARGGQLFAVGTLTGTLTNLVTDIVQQVSEQIRLPVTAATGTCDILELTLGPLDLNLLGLMVHLDQVHLKITAQQGPGNLLGNLLCAIAGLLDSQTSANALARLLNQLLGLLG